MDLVADESTLGKEPAVDLKEGVFTLPVILALRHSEHRDELLRLLQPGRPDEGRLHRVLEIVRSDGALALARATVTREVRRAMAQADPLPQGSARDALLHLAEFLAVRCGAPA
jgi:heptaprenyl diphosphate synthase